MQTDKAQNTQKFLLTIKLQKFLLKAAGDKLLMNKFIRQKFGGGLMLKNVISCTFGSRFRLDLTESLDNGGSATRLLLV